MGVTGMSVVTFYGVSVHELPQYIQLTVVLLFSVQLVIVVVLLLLVRRRCIVSLVRLIATDRETHGRMHSPVDLVCRPCTSSGEAEAAARRPTANAGTTRQHEPPMHCGVSLAANDDSEDNDDVPRSTDIVAAAQV